MKNNSIIEPKIVMAIARKELKSFFDQPAAYVLLLIFTGLSLFFFFQYEALNKEASLRIYFELLPWFLLFFIPAITMRSFSEEYRAGTIETILTKPVSNLDIVIGKYIGSYVYAMTPVALSLVLVISFSFFGILDYGVIAGQYFGALLLAAAFTALGMWMSSITKNQIVALIGSVVLGFLFMILNSDVVTANLSQSFVEAFNQLSFTSHILSISRGVIDVRDFVFFGSFIALFLLLSYMSLNRWLDYVSDRRLTYLAFFTVIVIALLNVAAIRMPLRIDLTRDKTYTLSKATIDVIKEAKGPIDITVYASSQLPSQMQLISRDVWDILNDYKRLSNGKITVKRLDPGSDKKIAREAASKGINPVQFNVYSESELKVNQGYFGLVMSRGLDNQNIPFIQSINDFEFQVSSGIAKISKTKMPKVAVVKGHGEGNLTNGYRLLGEELKRIAEIDELELTGETKEIPSKYDMLLILAPKHTELTDNEAKIIDEYVRSGGSLVALHNGVYANTQYMIAEKNEVLFTKLYKKWNIELKPELVYDLRNNMPVTAVSNTSQVMIPYPYFIGVTANSSMPVAKKIEGVLMQWASPIATLKKDDKSISNIFTTSDDSGITSGKFEINPMKANFNTKNLSKRIVGVQKKASKGYVLVIGDADFASDEAVKQMPQNISIILNAVDLYTDGKGLSEIKSKQASAGKLDLKSANQYDALRGGNIVAACAIIIIFGGYRLIRRIRRQNTYLSEYEDEEDIEEYEDEYENEEVENNEDYGYEDGEEYEESNGDNEEEDNKPTKG